MEAVLRHEGYRITATNVEVYDFVISISKAEKNFETIEQWLKENV